MTRALRFCRQFWPNLLAGGAAITQIVCLACGASISRWAIYLYLSALVVWPVTAGMASQTARTWHGLYDREVQRRKWWLS